MTVVACLSVKGAPGVTTLSTGLAATWPNDRQVLLAEIDPSGGDLGARFGVSLDKSIVGLAAAGRHGNVDVKLHTTALPGGLTALLGLPSAEQSRSAVSVLMSAWMPQLKRNAESDVILDCGRMDITSPAFEALTHAATVLVCLRPTLSDVAHTAAFLSHLRARTKHFGIVVIGAGQYGVDEIAIALDAPVLAQIPHDPSGAELLSGGRGSKRAMGRSPMIRSCQDLALQLVVSSYSIENVPDVRDDIEVAS